ncbi:MAG: hypothetical protein EAX96_02250 [Candidatus Lokiarchaeota archaeon]|nr:hypothetical protein [Candidatus Lokiarchaeota archaeon]
MNLYDFFKTTFSLTFIIEMFCLFTIPISFIFFGILVATQMINTALSIIFIFVSLGTSCLIILLGIGIFIRIRDKFLSYLGEEERFRVSSLIEKIVLGLWIAALIFFGIAVFYSISLIYLFFVFSSVGFIFTIFFIFILVGIILVCLILQLFIIIMVRFTKSIVSRVLDQ